MTNNLITNTENYFATVASNSKIDAMRFAMACIKHNPKRRVLFVCSVQDKHEYLSLIEDCLMVEKIVKHSGEVYIKNADTYGRPSIMFQHYRSGREEALAGWCLHNFKIIVSESYLTDKAKQVLMATITNDDNALIVTGVARTKNANHFEYIPCEKRTLLSANHSEYLA
ncbi:hypothetical protein [Vibrio parahaemolyticus]|uniref:hypothetical protein n=1 Tax=Vibrio parahaemolyticus TaxID=670 RepID=UPI00041D0F61|nr:hypothetical protein [Vibrio parahaemolyticus]ELA6667935.1 hypothetical protein [Vibrio parahaemolyticus]MQF57095.1 hypothetical protein [Vibrio parahaemolyticus]HBB9986379.1 hypothetical protein [Vibrio parahaemolyticus]HCE1923292.1 hypothetical protein [Vibrio parahaemolyticus]